MVDILVYKIQVRLGNQVSNTYHGPDSTSDLFGQFFEVTIPVVLLEKGCDSNRFLVFWEFTLSERVIKKIAHRHTNEVSALPNKAHRFSVYASWLLISYFVHK